jgi:hypothetical protein
MHGSWSLYEAGVLYMKIDLHRLGGVTRNIGSPRFGQALFSLNGTYLSA